MNFNGNGMMFNVSNYDARAMSERTHILYRATVPITGTALVPTEGNQNPIHSSST